MPPRSLRASSARYPPFGRLASLVISGPDRPAAEGFARRLAAAARPRVADGPCGCSGPRKRRSR